MRDAIKEKLDKIDQLYPPQRLEKSKDRWRRLWSGQEPIDRYPFVAGPINVSYDAVVGWNFEERLQAALDEILVRGHFRDDYIPAIFPGCRQSTIPSMFGAEEILIGEDCTCTKIIFTETDIDHMPSPTIPDGSVAWHWLQMQQYFCDQTEGRIPIHVTDMQGPSDVAGQLWGYDNVLMQPYTDVDRYVRLLDLTTEAFMMFWQAQMDVIGKDRFVGNHLFAWDWMPPDTAATISVDSMVMVSADYFDQYYAPYLIRIGERFGGFVTHACGNFAQIVKSLNKTPYIKGINASQMSVEDLLEAGADKRLVMITGSSMDDVGQMFNLIRRENLRVDLTVNPWPKGDNTRFPERWTEDDWRQIHENEARILDLAALN